MNLSSFKEYQTGECYDEMFGREQAEPFPHYSKLYNRISSLTEREISDKRRQADSSFFEHGITFTVYGDDQGTAKIFPFDLIP